jgi:16S rRNA (cytidine1402-2'-O)-methyltransferase
MPEEKSFSDQLGCLYVVATPIGNLEDITQRALRILENVSLIACEDTRQTIKILNTFKIKNKLISYFHPKEHQKVPKILSLLQHGKDVALVSDAGTPGISDPGYPLIKKAIEQGVRIIPVPGPSAVTTALSAAGMPTHRFLFLSFPSPKKTAAKKLLASLRDEPSTLVFYLPSRRLQAFLKIILETLGDRQAVVAREMTKVYESFVRKKVSELLFDMDKTTVKGELTLLIQGCPKTKKKRST